MSLSDLSIAPELLEERRQVRITHPFHCLKGRRFELIEYRCIYGKGYVYFHDERGQLREIPAAWTDFVKGDVFVELARGRSPLHARTLRDLADLVARLLGKGRDDV